MLDKRQGSVIDLLIRWSQHILWFCTIAFSREHDVDDDGAGDVDAQTQHNGKETQQVKHDDHVDEQQPPRE